jgi:hypothetical protein
MSRCGIGLIACRCGEPVRRSAAEIASAHRQAVARARGKGWGLRPAPREVVEVLLPLPRRHERAA